MAANVMAPDLLRGKRALVTGGTRGIGAGVAGALRDAGAEVVVSARTEPADADEHFVVADMSRAADIEALAARTVEILGGLDILVSNAGSQTRRPEGILTFTDADWEGDFAINLYAAVRLDRLLVPRLIEAGGGSIVHISSGAARVARPPSIAYSASKAALDVYSKGLADEVGRDGIRVHTVAPGLIRTASTEAVARERGVDPDTLVDQLVEQQNIPLGRIGTPAELGAFVVFLVSPAASYLTGGRYDVDGGAMPYR